MAKEDYFFEYLAPDGSWRAGAWVKDNAACSHISDPVEAGKEFDIVRALLLPTSTRLCKRALSEAVEVIG